MIDGVELLERDGRVQVDAGAADEEHDKGAKVAAGLGKDPLTVEVAQYDDGQLKKSANQI